MRLPHMLQKHYWNPPTTKSNRPYPSTPHFGAIIVALCLKPLPKGLLLHMHVRASLQIRAAGELRQASNHPTVRDQTLTGNFSGYLPHSFQ